MKRFNKIFSLFSVSLLLAGCNSHVHEFYYEWSMNEYFHWHECMTCNEVSDKEEHKYAFNMKNLYYCWKECKCGKIKDKRAHDWGDGLILTYPTETKTGKIRYICSYCKNTGYNTIPMVVPTETLEYINNEDNLSVTLKGHNLETFIDESSYIIPSVYNDLPVTKIENLFYVRAFITLHHVEIDFLYIPRSIKSFGANCFNDIRRINLFVYEGTLEEWNAIEKGENWDTGLYNQKLYCRDETIWIKPENDK